jgi:hypothetical protein
LTSLLLDEAVNSVAPASVELASIMPLSLMLLSQMQMQMQHAMMQSSVKMQMKTNDESVGALASIISYNIFVFIFLPF